MKTETSLTSLIALILVVVTFSCRKWEEPGGGGGGNTNPAYSMNGMFKDYSKLDGCKWVFESKEGKKYEVGQWIANIEIKEGVAAEVRVRNRSGASVCMVGQPIDVLSVTYGTTPGQVNCKLPVKIYSGENNQTVSVLNAAQNGNYLKIQLGYSGCNFDEKPINLYWDGNISKTNPASLTLKLINQPRPQNCLAYFTAETCFDLSPFKTFGSTLLITIEGYKDSPVTIRF